MTDIISTPEKSTESHQPKLDRLYGRFNLPTEDSIRVLDLLPGKDLSETRVALRTVRLKAKPEYEALSYTWGASTDGYNIKVNDEFVFPVTDNLHNALRRLRNRWKKRTFWIDAICINQADLEERSQQVKIMGKIYQSASCVCIWLGEPAAVSASLREVFTDLSLRRFLVLLLHPRAFLSWLQLGHIAMNGVINNTSPQWHRRAWTIQEFAFARRAYFHFGKQKLLYRQKTLEALALARAKPETQLSKFASQLSDRWVSANAKENSRYGMPPDALRIALLLGSSEAGDPRDMVYSLLSLIETGETAIIDPDYRLSYQQAYAKTTAIFIQRSCSFEALYHVDLDAIQRIHDAMPTWCVDFRRVGKRAYSALWGIDVGYTTRLAELNLDRPRAILHDSHRYLSLQGSFCGSICRVHNVDYTTSPFSVPTDFTQECVSIGESSLDTKDGSKPGLDLLRQVIAKQHQRYVRAKEVGVLKQSYPQIHQTKSSPGNTSIGVRDMFNLWSSSLLQQPDSSPESLPKHLQADPWNLKAYRNYVVRADAGEPVMFALEIGLIGLGPASITNSDMIVLVNSAWPFVVVRPKGERFQFLGMVYVHGLMDSSFWSRWSGEGLEEDMIELQ